MSFNWQRLSAIFTIVESLPPRVATLGFGGISCYSKAHKIFEPTKPCRAPSRKSRRRPASRSSLPPHSKKHQQRRIARNLCEVREQCACAKAAPACDSARKSQRNIASRCLLFETTIRTFSTTALRALWDNKAAEDALLYQCDGLGDDEGDDMDADQDGYGVPPEQGVLRFATLMRLTSVRALHLAPTVDQIQVCMKIINQMVALAHVHVRFEPLGATIDFQYANSGQNCRQGHCERRPPHCQGCIARGALRSGQQRCVRAKLRTDGMAQTMQTYVRVHMEGALPLALALWQYVRLHTHVPWISKIAQTQAILCTTTQTHARARTQRDPKVKNAPAICCEPQCEWRASSY